MMSYRFGRQVHVYCTVTKQWREATPPPHSFTEASACMLSPKDILLHTNKGTLVVTMPLTPEEREEIERVQREEAQERERERLERERLKQERKEISAAERRDLATVLSPLGLSPDSLSLDTLTDTVLPHLVSRVLSLERQNTSQSQSFKAYTKDTSVSIRPLIERAAAFDVSALEAATECLSLYVPVAKRVAEVMPGLREFLEKHPVDKLPSLDCPSLLISLSAMHTPYQSDMETLCTLSSKGEGEGKGKVEGENADDPTQSMAYLTDASELLDSISAAHPIPLPRDPGALSLLDTRKYYQVETHNTDCRELYTVSGPIIDCQASIQQCMSGLSSLTVPDLSECKGILARSQALLTTLSALAPRQTEAQGMVQGYKAIPTVDDGDVECAEYDMCGIEYQLKHPRLTEGKRVELTKDLSSLQAKVAQLKGNKAQRDRLQTRLRDYLVFPQVADALSLPLAPLDPSDTMCRECSGVGMMVKRKDAMQ
ncbi:hypothetical protein KIPB_008293 [Kipferlia bialata]|uniref:Uncharacterized protein n=1 Tax=Kipferlia bialata TaxID=797122 RepID=A0A9K3CZR7_9EUKA|nr:hypothetical protein KIPB_008293 [Kipferlia bialata]|eukprot:g8293.t1